MIGEKKKALAIKFLAELARGKQWRKVPLVRSQKDLLNGLNRSSMQVMKHKIVRLMDQWVIGVYTNTYMISPEKPSIDILV